MTTEVHEENANPYNQKKSWHTDIEENFEDANGLYFEKPKAKSKKVESVSEELVEQEATRDEPYKLSLIHI